MHRNESTPALSEGDSQDVLEALERLLVSEDFVSAPRLSALLAFIVTETLEGRSTYLKGFNIANQVFGRDETFDARTDPLVRVQANRLRKALERYYLLGGKEDAWRITVPKGSYAAVFERREDSRSGRLHSSVSENARPTVAVLPIESIGSDVEQDYFATGMTAELTSSLAQVENFMVIGRHSTLRYSGSEKDLRDIGAELGVRFILNGSVQRRSDSIRITAQLNDTETGIQVWANRYERNSGAEDLFDMQDEIVAEVIGTVSDAYGVIPRLLEKETRGKRAKDLESYDAILRFYHYQTDPSLEAYQRASRGLKHTIGRDPDYALALAALAELRSDNFGLYWIEPYDQLDEAKELARRAIALDPSCQQAHYSMAFCHFYRRERPGCLQSLQRVVELNPHAPYYAGAAGWMMALAGDWERGLAILERSKERNPFHPTWFNVAPFQYYFMNKAYDKALEHAELFKMPGLPWDRLLRAAALSRLGRREDARVLIDDLLNEKPNFPDGAYEYLYRYIFEEELAGDIYSALVAAGMPKA